MTGTAAADQARSLLRAARTASLATLMEDGSPYASLVTVAPDADLAPILLLSDLSQHSRNVARDPRVSLLIDGTEEYDDPLEGPRLTLLGRAERAEKQALREAFLERHPAAARYADFADFHFHRVILERLHLVSGFGKVRWLEPEALRGESSQ